MIHCYLKIGVSLKNQPCLFSLDHTEGDEMNKMSNMMKSTGVLSVSISALMLAACGSNSSGTESGSTTNASLAAGCSGSQKILSASDMEGLALRGQGHAATHEMVMTSINQDIGCGASSAVTWKLSAGQVISTDGNRLVARFDQPGTYFAQATISGAAATQGQAKVGTDAKVLLQAMTIVDNVPALQGPQVAMIGMDLNFALVLPGGMEPETITWNFGDGSATVTGASAPHMYELSGHYTVQVNVKLKTGASYDLEQGMEVLEYYDDFNCLPEAQIFAPQIAEVGVPVDLNAHIPACLRDSISAVRWTFGDVSNQMPGLSVQHTYNTTGVYEIKADVYSPVAADGVLFSLTTKIRINEKEPEQPAPKCLVLGERRTNYSNENSQSVACGLSGKKQVTRHLEVVEECQYTDLIQDWAVVSSQDIVKSEGACSNQACALPGGGQLADGGRKMFYSSARPAGSCADVSETRLCENGQLSGSAKFNQLTCLSGCPGFGIHESKKNSIVIGEIQLPLKCQFGEQGFFDLFHQVEDRQCLNGQIKATNQRGGEIKVKGVCPTYKYVATSEWTACDANCGGQQSQVHVCKDQDGKVATAARCGSVAPTVKRLCDANPGAVRRQEVATQHEEANSSNLCPKNQIGIVLKSREVTTTKTFACLNHAVKLESEKVIPTAWVEEKYCREYVAHRCSHDSLSNSEAKGRYAWMVKCQNQVPVIKEFLEKFDDVKTSQNAALEGGSRLLYPSFMNAGYRPEQAWIAPKKVSASCNVPAKIYVATVCVASCATPEQEILTEIKERGSFGAQTFIQALTDKTKNVVTLTEDSSLQKMSFKTTAVSNWVTELVDSEHAIIEFRMRSGGKLRLTLNHPLLGADGIMKEAQNFKAGDSLLKMGGVKDTITSVVSTKHFGKVYNLFTASSELSANIVVTNGYLNGTAFFQNEASNMMNRQLIRGRLIQGAFSK